MKNNSYEMNARKRLMRRENAGKVGFVTPAGGGRRATLAYMGRMFSLVLALGMILNSLAIPVGFAMADGLTMNGISLGNIASEHAQEAHVNEVDDLLIGGYSAVDAPNTAVYFYNIGYGDDFLFTDIAKELQLPFKKIDEVEMISVLGDAQEEGAVEAEDPSLESAEPLYVEAIYDEETGEISDYAIAAQRYFQEAGLMVYTGDDMFVIRLVRPEDYLEVIGEAQGQSDLPGEAASDAQAPEETAEPAYSIGDAWPVSLSAILSELGLPIEATEVGFVTVLGADDVENWTEPVYVESVDGDYMISVLRDFESAKLGLYVGEDITTVTLTGGIARADEPEEEPVPEADEEFDFEIDETPVPEIDEESLPEDAAPVAEDIEEIISEPEKTDATVPESDDLPADEPEEAPAAEIVEAPVPEEDAQIGDAPETETEPTDDADIEPADALAQEPVEATTETSDDVLTETPDDVLVPEDIAYPAQMFMGRSSRVVVTAEAPEGAFPEGTQMKVRPILDRAQLDDIADTVSEDFVEVTDVYAVDITFYDANGNEIEPLLPISVVMTVAKIEEQQEALVVHVDDNGDAEIVEQTDAPETVGNRLALNVELPATEEQTEVDNIPTEVENETNLSFDADGFSTYAIVITQTIETRYIDHSGATYKIEVGFGEDAGISADAILSVSEIDGDSAEEYTAQAVEALDVAADDVAYAKALDISIIQDGAPVQPQVPVQVSIQLLDVPEAAENGYVSVIHFGDEPETVDCVMNNGVVEFEADGFSVYLVTYTVDFHWGDFTYNLAGGSEIFLSELIQILGIDEFTMDDVERVSFSDPALVQVDEVLIMEDEPELYETDDSENVVEHNRTDWRLWSLAPFNTEESLAIALKSGDTVSIRVTDILYGYDDPSEVVSAAAGGRATADGVTYTLSNARNATVYAIAKDCTFHDRIWYKDKEYYVTNIRRTAAQLTATDMRVRMDYELIERIAGYSFNLPQIKTDISVEEQASLDGFIPFATNASSDYKAWKKAEYIADTNTIDYTMKYFQSMTKKVPLDFIFIYDDSTSMYSGTRTSNGVSLGEAQTTRVLILDAVKALLPEEKNPDYDINVYLGGTSTGDNRRSAEPFDTYEKVEYYLSEYRTGTTKYAVGLANALALAQDSVQKNRKPILIWLSDFHQSFSGNRLLRTGDYATADSIHALVEQAYCLTTDYTASVPVLNIASSSANIYPMRDLDDGVRQLEAIIKDAIGFYMRKPVTITDNLSSALSDVSPTNASSPNTALSSNPGAQTWTLGGQGSMLEAGTLYTETFSVSLGSDTVFAGSMPTNAEATLAVNGETIGSLTPDEDEPNKLHLATDLTFVVGGTDENGQVVADETGKPSKLLSGIGFTLVEAEADTEKSAADRTVYKAKSGANTYSYTTNDDGAFTVLYMDGDDVILQKGKCYLLSEDASAYNDNAANDTKLMQPDAAWILSVGADGVITMSVNGIANQTPNPTVWHDAPAKFALWNQIVDKAQLIPITVQKTWEGGEKREPVPFTIYGVYQKTTDSHEAGKREPLIAYSGKDSATATQVKYITGDKDKDVWTQTVYVSEFTDSNDSFFNCTERIDLNTDHTFKIDGVEYTAADLAKYADKDGKIIVGGSYSYAIDEDIDLVYEDGWYKPDFTNNASAGQKNTVYDETYNEWTAQRDPVLGADGKPVWVSYGDYYTGTSTAFQLHYNRDGATQIAPYKSDDDFYRGIQYVNLKIESKASNAKIKEYSLRFAASGSWDNTHGINKVREGVIFYGLELPAEWANYSASVLNYGTIENLKVTELVFEMKNGTKIEILKDGKFDGTSNRGPESGSYLYGLYIERYDSHEYNWAAHSRSPVGSIAADDKKVRDPGEKAHATGTSYTINSCTLSITNTWTKNPLKEYVVHKDWIDGEYNDGLGEDYNKKAEQAISYSIQGTTSKGTKTLPIFASADAAWNSGQTQRTLSGDTSEPYWKETIYLPTYDTSTYNRANTPACEAYAFSDKSIIEDADALNDVKDASGVLLGEWSAPTSEYTEEKVIPGATTTTQSGYKAISNDELENYTKQYYVCFELKNSTHVNSMLFRFKDTDGIRHEIEFEFNNTYFEGTYNVSVPFKWHKDTITSSFGNIADMELIVNGNSSILQRFAYSPITLKKLTNNHIPNNTIRKTWSEGGTETTPDTAIPATLTLTNTFTPYKAVMLSSDFVDETGDAASTNDSISSVVYAIRQDGEAERTVEIAKGEQKTVYLKPGDYTIEQTGIKVAGVAAAYPLTAYGVTHSMKVDNNDPATVSGAFVGQISDDGALTFTNTRKTLPATVQTNFQPELADGERPLGDETLAYELKYYSVNSKQSVSSMNGALNDASYDAASRNYVNTHTTSIPAYSVTGVPTECVLSNSAALDDYDTEALFEERDDAVVFTINATLKHSNIFINKTWQNEKRLPASLQFELKRSDGKPFYGLIKSVSEDGTPTFDTSKTTITVQMDGADGDWSAAIEDMPIIRASERDSGVRYVLKEIDGRDTYVTKYTDELGNLDRFAQDNSKEEASFVLAAEDALISVDNLYWMEVSVPFHVVVVDYENGERQLLLADSSINYAETDGVAVKDGVIAVSTDVKEPYRTQAMDPDYMSANDYALGAIVVGDALPESTQERDPLTFLDTGNSFSLKEGGEGMAGLMAFRNGVRYDVSNPNGSGGTELGRDELYFIYYQKTLELPIVYVEAKEDGTYAPLSISDAPQTLTLSASSMQEAEDYWKLRQSMGTLPKAKFENIEGEYDPITLAIGPVAADDAAMNATNMLITAGLSDETDEIYLSNQFEGVRYSDEELVFDIVEGGKPYNPGTLAEARIAVYVVYGRPITLTIEKRWYEGKDDTNVARIKEPLANDAEATFKVHKIQTNTPTDNQASDTGSGKVPVYLCYSNHEVIDVYSGELYDKLELDYKNQNWKTININYNGGYVGQIFDNDGQHGKFEIEILPENIHDGKIEYTLETNDHSVFVNEPRWKFLSDGSTKRNTEHNIILKARRTDNSTVELMNFKAKLAQTITFNLKSAPYVGAAMKITDQSGWSEKRAISYWFNTDANGFTSHSFTMSEKYLDGGNVYVYISANDNNLIDKYDSANSSYAISDFSLSGEPVSTLPRTFEVSEGSDWPKTIHMNKTTGWTKTLTGLPINGGEGVGYTYWVEEVSHKPEEYNPDAARTSSVGTSADRAVAENTRVIFGNRREVAKFHVTKVWTDANNNPISATDPRVINKKINFEIYQVPRMSYGGSGGDTHNTNIPPEAVVEMTEEVWPTKEIETSDQSMSITINRSGGFFYYDPDGDGIGDFYIIVRSDTQNQNQLGNGPASDIISNSSMGVKYSGNPLIDFDSNVDENIKDDSGSKDTYHFYYRNNKWQLDHTERGDIVKYHGTYYVIWNGKNGNPIDEWEDGTPQNKNGANWYSFKDATGVVSGGSGSVDLSKIEYDYTTQTGDNGATTLQDRIQDKINDAFKEAGLNADTAPKVTKYRDEAGKDTFELAHLNQGSTAEWTKDFTLNTGYEYYVVETSIDGDATTVNPTYEFSEANQTATVTNSLTSNPAYIKLDNKSSNDYWFKLIVDGGKYGMDLRKRGDNDQSPQHPLGEDGAKYYSVKVGSGKSNTLYLPQAAELGYRVEVYKNENLTTPVTTLNSEWILVAEDTTDPCKETNLRFEGTLVAGPIYQIVTGENKVYTAASAPDFKELKRDEETYYNSHRDNARNSYNIATTGGHYVNIHIVDEPYDIIKVWKDTTIANGGDKSDGATGITIRARNDKATDLVLSADDAEKTNIGDTSTWTWSATLPTKTTAVEEVYPSNRITTVVVDKEAHPRKVTITNVRAICKIVDERGEHPFATLNEALAFARSGVSPAMSANNSIQIEMLVDYVMPESDRISLNQNDNITFTTAATDSGRYNFEPTFGAEQGRTADDSDSIAILKRGYNGESLFTVDGDGALTLMKITVDGDKANYNATGFGGLVLAKKGSLTLDDGATLTNSKTISTFGGAVNVGSANNTATLTIKNGATVSNSEVASSTGDAAGGGIYVREGSTLNMQGGTVSGNTAANTGTATPKGAGIYLGGSATFTGGTISGNVFSGKGEGGGIYIENGEATTLVGVAITDNKAYNGGGIYVNSGSLTVKDGADISGNEATSVGSDTGFGGGIYGSSKATIEIDGTEAVISGNDARYGGGVYAGKSVKLTAGKITGNTSKNNNGNGGGVATSSKASFTMTGGEVSDNTAYADGGGIMVNGTATISGGIISGNTAKSATNNSKVSNGGGIYVNGGTVTMGGARISNNTATNGGGIYINSGTVNHVAGTSTEISGNSATDGGAIYVNSGATYGNFADVNFYSNSATNGGAIYSKGTLNLDGNTIIGDDGKSNTAARGGGVYVAGGTATLVGSTKVQYNKAENGTENSFTVNNGAGLFLAGGTLNITGSAQISHNEAQDRGGALYTEGGTANINGSAEVSDNVAHNDEGGGGLYIYSATLNMHGGTISNNKVVDASSGAFTGQGGGVRLANGGVTFNMTGGSISGNQSHDGAGVYTGNDSVFNMSGGAISGNAATGKGGGICHNSDKAFTMTGGTITGNTASDTNGGGINTAENTTINFSGSPVITGNTGKDGAVKNVVLEYDKNTIINTSGLGENADIGVYVVENYPASTPKVGYSGGYAFGKYTRDANLHKFTNDRNNMLYGVKGDADGYIYWTLYIARVSNDDGNTWTYHEWLIDNNDSPVQQNGKTIKIGAFDEANTLKDNVIIETLLESHERYTMTGGYTFDFNNATTNVSTSLMLRTTSDEQWNPDGFTSTIIRGFDGASMITFTSKKTGNNIMKVANITLDGGRGTGEMPAHTATENGGIISVLNGSLTIEDGATLRNSVTTRDGGAVYVASNKKLIMTGGIIDNCKAANGGGVCQKGGITGSGGEIKNCVATAKGGGICTDQANIMLGLSGTNITNCVANQGGGVYIKNVNSEITAGTISGCKATLNGELGTGNSVVAGTDTSAIQHGGGIYAEGIQPLKVGSAGNSVQIKDCEAAVNGGGIYAIREETNVNWYLFLSGAVAIDNCKAGNNGGGIYSERYTQTTDCSTAKHLTISNCEAGANGGGICFKHSDKRFLLQYAEMSDCRAGENGGAMWIACRGTQQSPQLFGELINVTIDGCVADATQPNKAITNAKNGGGIYLAEGKLQIKNASALRNCTADLPGTTRNDTASSPNIQSSEDATDGGGIFAATDTEIEISEGSSFTNCVAAGYSEYSEEGGALHGNGGAIFTNGKLTVKGYANKPISFKSCSAYVNGGAIAVSDENTEVKLTGCNIDTCRAKWNSGGGVYVYAKKLTMESCKVQSSTAYNRGGGIVIQKAETTITSSVIGGTKTVSGTQTEAGNTAVAIATLSSPEQNSMGGGLYMDNGATVTLTNTEISNNTAITGGGVALYNWTPVISATLNVSSGDKITNNKAIVGGGAYVSGGMAVNLTGGEIKGNAATNLDASSGVAPAGAGIYLAETGPVSGQTTENTYGTLNISGKPDFGGTDTYAENEKIPTGSAAGDIKGNAGNFVLKDASFKNGTEEPANGGKTYPKDEAGKYKVRQDIFIAGTVEPIKSVVVTNALTDDPGTIWVWAENEKHYKNEMQFAVFADSYSPTETEEMLKVFRNAQPDAITGNPNSEMYLYGVAGSGKNIIWGTDPTGGRKVILRKVTSGTNRPLAGARFKIYRSNLIEIIEGRKLDDSGKPISEYYESGDNGVYFIGTLPYGTYYLLETKAPNDNYKAGAVYVLVVSAEGVTLTEDMSKNLTAANEQGFIAAFMADMNAAA